MNTFRGEDPWSYLITWIAAALFLFWPFAVFRNHTLQWAVKIPWLGVAAVLIWIVMLLRRRNGGDR